MSERITSYCNEFNKKRKSVALAGAALTLGVGLSSFLSGCGAGNVGAAESDPAPSSSSAEGTSSSNNAYSAMAESSASSEKFYASEDIKKLEKCRDLDQLKDSEIEIPYSDSSKAVAQAFADRLDLLLHVGVNNTLADKVKKDPKYIDKLVEQTDTKFLEDLSGSEPINKQLLGWYDEYHKANLYAKLENKTQDLSVTAKRFPDIGVVGRSDPLLDRDKYGDDAVRIDMIIRLNGAQEPHNVYETNNGGKDVSFQAENPMEWNLIYKRDSKNKNLANIEDLITSSESGEIGDQ